MVIQVGDKMARVPNSEVSKIQTTVRAIIGVYGNTPKVRGICHRIEKNLLEKLIEQYSN